MGNKRGHYSDNNYGREMAERHVQEAKQFSEEMGGTDVDVKQYFFSLPQAELNVILKEYGRQYGYSAEEYARSVFNAWRIGKRRMSGLVAKRLFALLPPRMPLDKKYELADNIWRNFAPKTEHTFKIGCNANVLLLAEIIANKLNQSITEIKIPINIKNRFSWLSAGDIQVEEQLLNHFRQQLKALAAQKILYEVPVLQKQMIESSEYIGLAKTVIVINKNEISVVIDKNLDDEIFEVQQITPKPVTSKTVANKTGCLLQTAVLILVLFFILAILGG